MPSNTPSVYPKPDPPVCPFFSALPRAVGDLRAEGQLKPRDVDVLRELLDHKRQGTTLVEPRQKALAARMGCSVDTVQRSLQRLEAAGLLAVFRLRDARGRLGRCRYDLAPTLALMPRQAAKLRSGNWGRPARPEPPARPQNCGFSEGDSDSVDRADSRVLVMAHAAPSPAARALAAEGVFPKTAAALAETFGEARCREVLAAAGQVKRFHRSKAAWLVAVLTQRLPVAAPDTARPRSQWPYAPLSAPPSLPPDSLEALSPDAYAGLEAQARALLWEETRPAWRERLLNGRSPAYVRTRMRALLEEGEPPCPR